ncbi:hypothetical protein J6590_005391 [Homalodisca vitripennis]|nr:hypothetical protein J6590_005391 [Homalodisca vitripennis]
MDSSNSHAVIPVPSDLLDRSALVRLRHWLQFHTVRGRESWCLDIDCIVKIVDVQLSMSQTIDVTNYRIQTVTPRVTLFEANVGNHSHYNIQPHVVSGSPPQLPYLRLWPLYVFMPYLPNLSRVHTAYVGQVCTPLHFHISRSPQFEHEYFSGVEKDKFE